MLIYVQHYAAYQQGRVPEPTPTYVAGFHQWLSLGRHVDEGPARVRHPRSGHRPVRLLDTRTTRVLAAPRPRREAQRRASPSARSWSASSRPTSGTSPRPTATRIPELPRPTLLQGQAPAGLWDGLADQITARGFELRLVSSAAAIGGANGLTDFLTREVSVRMDMDDAAQVKTLAHELGHVLLHGPDNADAAHAPRHRRGRSRVGRAHGRRRARARHLLLHRPVRLVVGEQRAGQDPGRGRPVDRRTRPRRCRHDPRQARHPAGRRRQPARARPRSPRGSAVAPRPRRPVAHRQVEVLGL